MFHKKVIEFNVFHNNEQRTLYLYRSTKKKKLSPQNLLAEQKKIRRTTLRLPGLKIEKENY